MLTPEPAKAPDTFREILEMVVFVVVLVLLLKMFAAEAFVIPTGSMATTLLGDNRKCTCPKCKHVQRVNCHQEVEPEMGPPLKVERATCENCHFVFDLADADASSSSSGDRVLVAKFYYDGPFSSSSDLGRQIVGLLAIVIGALIGARAAGNLAAWIVHRRQHANQQGRGSVVVMLVRIVGALACAAIIGYCILDSGPAWAMSRPERDDVVVFKYPKGPQTGFTPMNYIKRLIGKPGETIGIKAGKLYHLPPEKSPKYSWEEEREPILQEEIQREIDRRIDREIDKRRKDDKRSDSATLRREVDTEKFRQEIRDNLLKPPEIDELTRRADARLKLDLWQSRYMHKDDPRARDMFDRHEFQIIRKSADKIIALMRPVYDNNEQPQDVPESQRQRWIPDGTKVWKPSGKFGFEGDGGSSREIAWLRYEHRVPTEDRLSARKSFVTDLMSYNTQDPVKGPGGVPISHPAHPQNWVRDLILECDATIDSSDGEFILQLSKGPDRFQARWQLASGKCSLIHVLDAGTDHEKQETLKEADTSFKGKGTRRRLRFADVDDRLTVWVDGALPFRTSDGHDGVDYEGRNDIAPTESDREPAAIGLAGGAVRVDNLRLFRDTYYTQQPGPSDMPWPWSIRISQDSLENLKSMNVPDSILQRLQGLKNVDFANQERLSDRLGEILDSRDLDKETRDKLRKLIVNSASEWPSSGPYPYSTWFVQPGHYLCLGDNSPASSDSRAWGVVPERLLLGRALLVYWPIGQPVFIR